MYSLTVMAPKDEPELQNMLYSALRYERLVAIRYPRGKGPGHALVESYEEIPYGHRKEIQFSVRHFFQI